MRFKPVGRVVTVVALVAGATGAALTAGAALESEETPGPGSGSPSATVSVPAPPQVSYLQVVAHQDDDLLFMNPDITHQGGAPSATVYLTAGEADGSGFRDRCAYADSREAGARAAHARLAGVADRWSRTALTLSTGNTVEVDTLDAAPQVALVFVGLHESGDSAFNPKGRAGDLLNLSLDRATAPNTTLGSLGGDGHCDPAYAGQRYGHGDVVAVLLDLMNRYRPTVVLTQDPKAALMGAAYHTDTADRGDHADHVGAARLTGEALASYHGPDGDGRVLLRNYRDYNIRTGPPSLDATRTAAKRQTFLDYLGPGRAFDPSPVADESTFYRMFQSRQYPRWSNGTTWSALDRSGRLNAFAVVDGRAEVWREQTSGGRWSGPQELGSGLLAPALTVIKGVDGLLRLVGVRLSDDQVVTATETEPGVWGGWTSLGAPGPGDPALLGAPTAVLQQGGGVLVFVRNPAGGVSVRGLAPDGQGSGAWTDLGGGGVQDGLAAALARDGRVELFAPAAGGVLHWRQTGPGGAFVRDPAFAAAPPAGPLTVARSADGRLQLFYAQGGTGLAVTQDQHADGTWNAAAVPLGGPAVQEGLAALTGGDGRMTLVARNGGGGVSTTFQTAPDGAFGTHWPDLGSAVIGTPTACLDAAGRVVALALGPDAGLLVSRQAGPGADRPFGPWESAEG